MNFTFPPGPGMGNSELWGTSISFHGNRSFGSQKFQRNDYDNPPLDYVLKDDDDVIVLAEDDSTINYSSHQVIEPKTRVTLPIGQIYLSKNT